MSRLLIRNARITRADGSTFDGDALCDSGRIAKLGPAIDERADETLDAQGLSLLPGVIDPHVHFREPGKEYKEDLGSGSRAAVRGGVTSFPGNAQYRTADRHARHARRQARARGENERGELRLFIGATPDNLDELNAAQGRLRRQGIHGLQHRRPAGGQAGRPGTHLRERRPRHRRARRRRNPPAPAPPAASPDAPIRRCIPKSATTNRRASPRNGRWRCLSSTAAHCILHLSTREEVELLRRNKPAWVKAEVSPNHLFLNTASTRARGRARTDEPADPFARGQRRALGRPA